MGDEEGAALTIAVSCSMCGGSDFALPRDADNALLIICNGCGTQLGSLGAIQASIKDAVCEELKVIFNDAITEAVREMPHFTLKF